MKSVGTLCHQWWSGGIPNHLPHLKHLHSWVPRHYHPCILLWCKFPTGDSLSSSCLHCPWHQFNSLLHLAIFYLGNTIKTCVFLQIMCIFHNHTSTSLVGSNIWYDCTILGVLPSSMTQKWSPYYSPLMEGGPSSYIGVALVNLQWATSSELEHSFCLCLVQVCPSYSFSVHHTIFARVVLHLWVVCYPMVQLGRRTFII